MSGNIFFFVNKMLLLVLHNTVGINVVCVTRIHIFQNDSSMINCKKKYYLIIFVLYVSQLFVPIGIQIVQIY